MLSGWIIKPSREPKKEMDESDPYQRALNASANIFRRCFLTRVAVRRRASTDRLITCESLLRACTVALFTRRTQALATCPGTKEDMRRLDCSSSRTSSTGSCCTKLPAFSVGEVNSFVAGRRESPRSLAQRALVNLLPPERIFPTPCASSPTFGIQRSSSMATVCGGSSPDGRWRPDEGPARASPWLVVGEDRNIHLTDIPERKITTAHGFKVAELARASLRCR